LRSKYKCKKCKAPIVESTSRNSKLCRKCWVENKPKRCRDCGKPIHKTTTQRRCRDCYLKLYRKKQNKKREKKTKSHTNCFECNKKLTKRFTKYCSRRCLDRYKKIKRRARKAKSVCFEVCRWEIYERDNFHCYICGVKVIPGARNSNWKQATLDHVVPLQLGGHHADYNLRCCCRRCNCKKRSRPLTEHLLITGLEKEAQNSRNSGQI